MHVQVQKFTRTTWSRSSAAPSGSELSHSVAPANEGRCTRSNRVMCSAKRSKARADLVDEQLRLFPGGEVPALVELVVVDQLGIGVLSPAARRLIELVGEDAHGHRDVHALGVE